MIARFAVLLLLSFVPVAADGFDDAMLNVLRESKASGIAVSVVSKDGFVLERGYGTFRHSAQTATPNTPFPIGEIGDTFTAATVAVLVVEGKLNLEQPIRELYPDFNVIDPYISQKTTLRDLVVQRTGLARDDNSTVPVEGALRQLHEAAPWRTTAWREPALDHLVRAVVAKTTGQGWKDFFTDRFLRPMEMQGTVVAEGYTEDAVDNRLIFGAPQRAQREMSTISDLGRWMRMLLAEGRLGNKPIMHPQAAVSIAQPYIPASNARPESQIVPGYGDFRGRGLGWNIMRAGTDKVIGQRGVVGDTSVVVLMVPARWRGVAVVVSGGGADTADYVANTLMWTEG